MVFGSDRPWLNHGCQPWFMVRMVATMVDYGFWKKPWLNHSGPWFDRDSTMVRPWFDHGSTMVGMVIIVGNHGFFHYGSTMVGMVNMVDNHGCVVNKPWFLGVFDHG